MRAFILFTLLVVTGITQAQITIIENANGYSYNLEGELVQFTSLAIEEGKVLAISQSSLADQYPNAERKDAKGKTLLPGLIDAHGHLLGLGKNLQQVNLRDATSAKQAARQTRDYAQKQQLSGWVLGRGWNQENWHGKAFPNKVQLDEYFKDQPVWLRRVDGHAAWANSKALAIAGIDSATLAPEGGKIIKDSQGEPTGILVDNAMALVEKHIPATDEKALNQQLDLAGKHLLSLGITSMHDAGIDHDTYHLYLERAKEKALPVRVYAMLAATDPVFTTMLERGPIQADKLSIRSVKVYGDGALGSRGAALLLDYLDDAGNTGLLLTPESQLKPLFDQVIGAGFQLNYHAIGDKANRLALDQFADTFERIGGKTLRHRIEHAQIISPADIPRFAKLDVIASMQPVHATSDMHMAEDRLGQSRLKGAYAWQSLLDAKAILAFGSDFPVELANPFHGLHAAVTRQDRNNQPTTGWRAQESLSIEEAFKAFTYNAAYAAHHEKELGHLMPGAWADFILLDRDIFAIPGQDIWRTQVLETWLAGEKRYQAE